MYRTVWSLDFRLLDKRTSKEWTATQSLGFQLVSKDLPKTNNMLYTSICILDIDVVWCRFLYAMTVCQNHRALQDISRHRSGGCSLPAPAWRFPISHHDIMIPTCSNSSRMFKCLILLAWRSMSMVLWNEGLPDSLNHWPTSLSKFIPHQHLAAMQWRLLQLSWQQVSSENTQPSTFFNGRKKMENEGVATTVL